MARPERIPVHVLTGFLGSGKTTLLNRALSSGFGPGTAVVVNEFGEVGLDQLFIQERSEETVVLKSGCICCSIRTDLVATLMQLAAMADSRRHQISRVVIETSGISDPVPILTTLQSDLNVLRRFRIGAVLCTIDPAAAGDVQTSPEALAQLAAADACIITKQDLVKPKAVLAARNQILAFNPAAEILQPGGAPVADWLGRFEQRGSELARAFMRRSLSSGGRAHSTRSIVVRGSHPQSWSKFAIWLSGLVFRHGDRILRIKGIMHDGERETWIAVNGVRRFLHPPEHLSLAAPPSCGVCLVFITDGLDPSRIEHSYHRFVAQKPDASAAAGAAATQEFVPSPEGVKA